MVNQTLKNKELLDIIENPTLVESYLDDISQGIKNSSEFRDACSYIIKEKLLKFKLDPLYYDEDEFVDLILPAFRRVWISVYIDTPDILNGPKGINSKKHKQRLELFQSLFSVDGFLHYLTDISIKTKGCLSSFEYLDKTYSHLSLIIDNYISMNLDISMNSKNLESDIRDCKIKNLINNGLED